MDDIMNNVPFAWSQNEILGLGQCTANHISTSHHPYNPFPHRPYSSHRPYDSHRPYESYRSYSSSTGSSFHLSSDNGKTLIRNEWFGASVCSPSGIPFKINIPALRFINELAVCGVLPSQLPKFIEENYPNCRSDFDAFINKCKKMSWLDAPFNWELVGKNEALFGRLAAPYSIFLYPSLSCNLAGLCSKCFVNLSNKDFKDCVLSVSDLSPTLTELNEMGIFNLIILGGEPLLYPYLYDLLEICKPLSFIVSLSTNGLLLSESEVDKLSNYMDRIQISLDGAYPKSAENIKGNGTFMPSIEGIKRLVSKGVSTIVSYVLTRQNSDNTQIGDFIKYMKDIGVSHISFIQYYPFGEAPDDNLVLEPVDNARIRELLARIKEEYAEILITHEDTFAFMNSSGPPDGFVPFEITTLGCECGRTRLSIYPNGDIVPCDFLADLRIFRAGNIFENRISDLWHNSKVLEMFRQRDIKMVEPCKSCNYQIQCRGGCHAMAWRKFENQNMPDPRCPRVRETLTL